MVLNCLCFGFRDEGNIENDGSIIWLWPSDEKIDNWFKKWEIVLFT